VIETPKSVIATASVRIYSYSGTSDQRKFHGIVSRLLGRKQILRNRPIAQRAAFSTFSRLAWPKGDASRLALPLLRPLVSTIFLIHRFDTNMPDGNVKGIEVVGYSRENNSYPMHSFDRLGSASVMHARIEKEIWTFGSESLRALLEAFATTERSLRVFRSCAQAMAHLGSLGWISGNYSHLHQSAYGGDVMAPETTIRDRSAIDWALLIARVVVGVVFMAHGAQKLFGAFEGPGPLGVQMMGPLVYLVSVGVLRGFWGSFLAFPRAFPRRQLFSSCSGQSEWFTPGTASS